MNQQLMDLSRKCPNLPPLNAFVELDQNTILNLKDQMHRHINCSEQDALQELSAVLSILRTKEDSGRGLNEDDLVGLSAFRNCFEWEEAFQIHLGPEGATLSIEVKDLKWKV